MINIVPDDEVWIHCLTNTKNLKRSDGSIHNSVFRQFRPPADTDSDWLAEMSGLRKSLIASASELRAKGVALASDRKAKAPPASTDIEFIGVMFAPASRVRSWTDIAADIIATPKDDEPAHADFVSRNRRPDFLKTDQKTRDFLSQKFDSLKVDQLEDLYK